MATKKKSTKASASGPFPSEVTARVPAAIAQRFAEMLPADEGKFVTTRR